MKLLKGKKYRVICVAKNYYNIGDIVICIADYDDGPWICNFKGNSGLEQRLSINQVEPYEVS